MSLIQLGALGEFFGAIAVFATLLFLAMQVRFARRTAEDTSAVMRSQGMREILFKLSEDPELSLVYARGLNTEVDEVLRGYERTDPDVVRFVNLCLAALVTLQASWQTDRSERGRTLTVSRLGWQMERPGCRAVWALFREVHFYEDFRAEVDALIADLPDPAVVASESARAA